MSMTHMLEIMQSIGFLGPAFFLTQLGHVHSPAMAVLCMACSQCPHQPDSVTCEYHSMQFCTRGGYIGLVTREYIVLKMEAFGSTSFRDGRKLYII